MEKEEVENKNTKKDLTLKIEDNHDKENTLIIRNFKSFLKKKNGRTYTKEAWWWGRESKRDLEIKKEESSKGKIQC